MPCSPDFPPLRAILHPSRLILPGKLPHLDGGPPFVGPPEKFEKLTTLTYKNSVVLCRYAIVVAVARTVVPLHGVEDLGLFCGKSSLHTDLIKFSPDAQSNDYPCQSQEDYDVFEET